MKRRAQNPFPGVTRVFDRHGKARWRFRMKGRPSAYLPGEYGSEEFRQAYSQAAKGDPAETSVRHHQHGTFDWLIEHYRRTPRWKKLAPISQKNLGNEFDRFSREYGTRRLSTLRQEHVEAIIAKKADSPAAANRLLKLLRRLALFGIKKGLRTDDPTIGAERYKENPDGFHTWTEDEIQKFEEHHGIASKAVCALRLILNTGAARQDVAALGWQNVRDGRISYRRKKTGGEVDLPMLDELIEVLRPLPADRMLFLTHTGDRPYKATTFGNWFHDQCVAAGLPHCSSHGLRKAGATRLADAGASELEIMAFLGHRTPDEARTYVKKFNRKRLGDTGMEKVARAKSEQGLSNRVTRLDIRRRKTMKRKDI
ncbi:tyrosine-type recombinase/integrase [Mesorhizobium sp. M4B.F.Ca.ET.013.02.1.1]|uniref:tyrosine-type recombinase/integrase n=1 Tax=Mesorhizobium sp. M4B.F.Ca.ET.013.02.1.1 TaxID=2496755 RepID=UPI000FD5EB62|nr:tyrosine-type recombinase/integrase [Mesorhizobium sp. M4B.F.Ca.ET.013.02.1.1]RUW26951.1 integrase [Mesorhizobium sp. M4B.F.Ca.ET.013.02.1.1]